MRLPRHPYVLPILAGTVAILFAVAVLVGWSIIFTRFYVVATEARVEDLGVGYWVLLSLGCVFLAGVVAVLVMLLVSQVRRTMQVRQQTAFIDSVSHELRSPLASLGLALDTLETRDLSPDERARFLAAMRRDVTRLSEFIERILEAGRIDHGERRLAWDRVDLGTLVTACRDRVAERRGVPPDVVRLDLGGIGPDARITTDRVALATIVENLLDNAIKYSDGRPDVSFTARREGERLRMTVTDRGIGIPRGHIRRIFARFHRAGSASSRAGTGLGLYVTAALVRRLGGRIDAHSRGPRLGSRFEVTLPLGGEARLSPDAKRAPAEQTSR